MLRHGIYYFHARINKNKTQHLRYKSGLIRKSLKTGNYREAVHKARILWLKYNMTKDEISMTEHDTYEAEIQYEANLYSRGKELHGVYNELDENDINLIDEFFAQEFGSSNYSKKFDEEAFQHYTDKNISSSLISNDAHHISTTVNIAPKPLHDFIDQYIHDCQYVYGNWKINSHAKFSQELQFFQWCMDGCHMHEITIDKIKSNYISKLSRFPAHLHRYKQLKDKDGKLFSIDKVLKITERDNLTKLSNKTIKGKITTVKAFIKWCVSHEYLNDNVLKAFAFTNTIKEETNERQPFDNDDLISLFNRPEFYNGLYHYKYAFRHWCLLIALYTGMRANEICQLKIKNIIKDKNTDIECFVITDEDDDQSVKNKSSKRIIPIHKTLIKLGFLNYVNHHRKTRKNNDLLFVQLSRHSGKGNYTQKLLKWFNEKYIYETGVKKRSNSQRVMKSFHSFRHTFIDYEKQHRLDREILEQVVGHVGGRTAHDGYQKKFGIQAMKKELDKVKFDINTENFKVWR